MRIKALNIILSVSAALLFLWVAFRNIDFIELWQQISLISYYWLPFFLITLFLSHFLRAERWRLLLPIEFENTERSTLFAGVMVGYVVNNIVPRLGEISRPIYVAKKTGLNSGNLIGTVVVERIFDVVTMLVIAVIAIFWLIKDLGAFENLFGMGEWSNIYYFLFPVVIFALFFSIWVFYKLILYIDSSIEVRNPVLSKILTFGKSFSEGLISLKNVRNWPKFIFLTITIWLGYILMVYLPFYMMQMQAEFGLNFWDAIVLTVASSIGVSVPTPAGIGSYHLIIQQSLYLLYEVPLAKALTYATVVHAITFLAVFIIGPLALWWDKAITMKNSINANS